MPSTDRCCTIVPYFKIHEGKIDRFKQMCGEFVERTRPETGCLFYGFSFDGEQVHCREGYVDAAACLLHLDSIGPLLQEALKIATITRLEIHAPEDQVALLRGPLADLNPQYFVMECGFRR